MTSRREFLKNSALATAGVALLGEGQRAWAGQTPPETQRLYLSGRGPSDAVPWDFFCTGGRRSGAWTTIPVPSQWEQHGFGEYNYGSSFTKHADEHGLYRKRFRVPTEWKGKRIRIVFDGVMTDASVKVNGRAAGPVHAGGFYRFGYDITALVEHGSENLLEVDVAKISATPQTDLAERYGDYWIFGGIYRSVYLEATPVQGIAHVALDVRADGLLTAYVDLASVTSADRVEAQVLSLDGKGVGASFSANIPGGGTGRVRLSTRVQNPKLWSAESPNLYNLRLMLLKGDELLHTVTERFGFRTFELRAGAGLFLNGARVVLKGANRHSFRPETGRSLDREDCYEDALLIKSMNMNAVRMSHYPPDVAFLDACDELGIYVLNELSGWQKSHDTETGRRLVREMVTRDVNHPSVIFWDNGNEGGWNRDLDIEFGLHDPQQRIVLHPWDSFNGIDTAHYKSYSDMEQKMRGPNLVMPTEFMHSLYDGGGAAGLEDYWKLLSSKPYGAGGFIWSLVDEGIKRTDKNGSVDVWSTFAPDGIVGPNHEKEGSYYAVRDIFSPIQIDAPVLDERFDGKVNVHNHYEITSLDNCRFVWRTLRFNSTAVVLREGTVRAPVIGPGRSGKISLPLPRDWRNSDAVSLTAFGPDGKEVWNWVWATSNLPERLGAEIHIKGDATAQPQKDGNSTVLSAAGTTVRFDTDTGLLQSLQRGDKLYALANGPRLVWARPRPVEPQINWLPVIEDNASDKTAWMGRVASPVQANVIEVELDGAETDGSFNFDWFGFQMEVSDGNSWQTIFNGTRRPIKNEGPRYSFSPQRVAAVRISGFQRDDGKPVVIKAVRVGSEAQRFPADGGSKLDKLDWTLHNNGTLELSYSYTLDGEFNYHGITFDHPEEKMRGMRWLGEGPCRVWKNRMRGTWLGVHNVKPSVKRAGETWNWSYPEFAGYFAGVRWATLDTETGPLLMRTTDPSLFLRVGTPLIDHPNTSVDFPPGDISLLHAIPAIGSKFRSPAQSGPASQPVKAAGTHKGSLIIVTP